jgi:glutaredoxin-dependent peroxiredoxin
MAIAVGTKAPDFTLKTKTADGLKDVSLADHVGKDNVVLLFFPAAFTGVCTQEMCDVTGGVHPLPGAVVYGVSHDSPFAQEAWAKANNIGVTLLSDYTNKVAEAYDVVLPDLVGLGPAAKRAAILIGKDGIVKYSEETPTPLELPNFTEIEAMLGSLSN